MISRLPKHLSENSSLGVVELEPVAQFEIGSMQNFVYLLLDWKTRQAAIVDPQKDLSAPYEALSTYGFELKTILLTHTHFDHIAGVKPLLKDHPDLEIRVGERDLHRLSEEVRRAAGLCVTRDQERFRLGELTLEAWLTPGHSAGAVSYLVPKQIGVDRPYLFTGDTIFIRDCGRTDLETGSNDEMFMSIQRVKTLSPETVFLVGHHYAEECATTLEDEMKQSGPFRVSTVEELASLP